jgi:type I restriction enzyme R subunit
VSNLSEEEFESAICASLLGQGCYDGVKNDKEQGQLRDFDPTNGLDTAELFAFIRATQFDNWNELVKRHGGDPNVAQAKFATRLAAELDKAGTVDVLRHGVVDQA